MCVCVCVCVCVYVHTYMHFSFKYCRMNVFIKENCSLASLVVIDMDGSSECVSSQIAL